MQQGCTILLAKARGNMLVLDLEPDETLLQVKLVQQ
jgi:hypothetical protein